MRPKSSTTLVEIVDALFRRRIGSEIRKLGRFRFRDGREFDDFLAPRFDFGFLFVELFQIAFERFGRGWHFFDIGPESGLIGFDLFEAALFERDGLGIRIYFGTDGKDSIEHRLHGRAIGLRLRFDNLFGRHANQLEVRIEVGLLDDRQRLGRVRLDGHQKAVVVLRQLGCFFRGDQFSTRFDWFFNENISGTCRPRSCDVFVRELLFVGEIDHSFFDDNIFANFCDFRFLECHGREQVDGETHVSRLIFS